MKQKKKIDQLIARGIAADIMTTLFTYCNKIEIAGDLRRGSQSVDAITLVVKPKTYLQQSMFSIAPQSHSILEAFHWPLLGQVIKNGPRRKQIRLPQGINLDLHIVSPPAQWGVILAINTGPADFSKWIVTRRDRGGALPSDYRVRGGAVRQGNELIEMPEEVQFLQFLGLGWIEPGDRYARFPGQMKLPVVSSSF